MSFGEAVRRCLTEYPVFAGRARPNEFRWLALLGLSALALTLGAFTRSAGLAGAGLRAIASLAPSAPTVMGVRP
jgi:hypothetical protein